jgi:hypothetical protein
VNELPLPPRLPALPTEAGVVVVVTAPPPPCCWDVGDVKCWAVEVWPAVEWTPKAARLLRLFNAGTEAMANEMGRFNGMASEGIRKAAADAAAAAAEDDVDVELLLLLLLRAEVGKATPPADGPR